ncbi:AMP-binding protein [Actinomadura madurae]|uniref:Acyl-CoA synthetase (AMP-forming)/AMP-acid ligase II n=2 Tax=Actinomadura TaxID=1988 RepID=A0A1I4ZQ01_9ACTN|nr:AMP-binding protein [Actinomadura madurae]SFN52344.1 Acyl-CoA synthetase (AMP-forming)/AMP-acid ligase II [Actinomadura madurae]SPT63230.1 Short-chain-fatty-acid--CoA ligase [Actinomadura madurae]
MTHARPAYRPGIRRRIGHIRDLTALLLRTGLLFGGGPRRLVRQLSTLRRWGTTLAGLVASSAARSPSRPALIDDEGVLTFAELDERGARLAAGLPLHGPRPRVGVLCRNHRGMALTLVACSRRGAEVVLLNTGFGAGQIRAVLGELRPALIVADAEFAPLLANVPIALRRTVLWADHRPGPRPAMPLAAPVATETLPPAPRPPLDPGPADPGPSIEEVIRSVPPDGAVAEPPQIQSRTIMLSSGTTGRPKGARRPPRPGLWPLASMTSRIPLRSRQTMIVEAPLFHTWGYAAMQMAWALRAPVVLHRRFDPEQTLRAVSSHRDVTVFAVPVMLQRVLELAPEVRGMYDTSSLRIAALSGAALPGDLATRFMDAFGDRLYNVYGSTEASWVSIATPRDLRLDPRTAGRPPRNTKLSILDDQGRPLGRSIRGHIFAANELLFEGYTGGEPMEVRDGLLSTGDLGHIDHRGLLFVDGRSDGMVVSGGENIVPRDVEDALLRLPEIHEVAVTGVADDEWGQRLAAYVVLRPGTRLDADAVRAYVHAQVARYAVPRDVYFIPELPRNATGKVVHRWLSARPGRPEPEGRVQWPQPPPWPLGAGRAG